MVRVLASAKAWFRFEVLVLMSAARSFASASRDFPRGTWSTPAVVATGAFKGGDRRS